MIKKSNNSFIIQKGIFMGGILGKYKKCRIIKGKGKQKSTLHNAKKIIGLKWVFRNKKSEPEKDWL